MFPVNKRPNEVRRRWKSSTYSTYSEDGTEWKHYKKEDRKFFSLKIEILLGALSLILTGFIFVVLAPSEYNCERYQLPNRPLLKGVLAVNDILTKAERFMEGQIHGPECLLVEGDRIYTGTQDGAVIEIRDGKVSRKIRFTDGLCGSYENEPECGRPLGIRRLNDNELVVADAYFGIYTVNFDKNSFKQVLDGKKIVAGKPMKFFNDIEVVSEDNVIFTVSSAKWTRRDFLKAVVENHPSGRVISLIPSTGEIKVLMDNLYFANGIQLFDDKQSFIVAETTMARILRHWISGPKAGKTEVFAENLPGLPDNIRKSPNGTFWVALNTIRRKTQFSMFDFLGDRTLLREVILKLVPNSYWPKIYKRVRPHHVMILQLNKSGDILSTAHDLLGSTVSDISHVSDDGSYLYLGSVHSNYLVRLSKSDL